MPLRALPTAAQTQLEQILADVERGLIAAETLLITGDSEVLPTGGVVLQLTDQRGHEHLRLALTAAATVVKIIGALPWPATDRRQAVDHWHDRIRRQCDVDRDRFIAERRQQPEWLAFQYLLAHATPARAFASWLVTAMDARPIAVPELARHLRVDDRAVWRWRAGATLPRRRVVIARLREIFGTTFAEIEWIFKRQSPVRETSVPQNRTKHSGKTRKRR